MTAAGTYTLIAEAAGYEKFETQVTPIRGGSITQNIPMTLATVAPGDMNGDGAISLADAVLALQMEAGDLGFSLDVHKQADVNRDGRIGVEEALYVLQEASGLR